jgi:type II secretory pathway component PulK
MAVLNALGPAGSANFTNAQSLAQSRQGGCFPTLQDFNNGFSGNSTAKTTADAMVTTQSNFFTLTSIVTIGSTQFALYSLLHVEGDLRVRPIQRSFTAD